MLSYSIGRRFEGEYRRNLWGHRRDAMRGAFRADNEGISHLAILSFGHSTAYLHAQPEDYASALKAARAP